MAVLGSDNISHSGDFKINVNSADRVTIDSDGRLLVGTFSAVAATTLTPGLQHHGIDGSFPNIGFGRWTNDVGGYAMYFAKSRGASVGTQAIVSNGDFLGALFFEGSDGTQLRRGASITANVDGTPGANSMPCRLAFSTAAAGESSPTERMRITNIGNILIGQTASATPGFGNTTVGASFEAVGGRALFLSRSNTPGLFINCNTNAAVASFRRSGTQVGTISVTTTNTAYNTSSDYRLKENVVDLDGAIDRLKQLPVHRFNFIVEPEITVDGFLAHEAQEIVPECVTGTKDEMRTAKDVVLSSDGKILSENIKMEDWESGKIPNEDDESTYPVDSTWTEEYEVPVYQGIDQAKIVPLLTAALQEAIKRIETLEARVLELEAS